MRQRAPRAGAAREPVFGAVGAVARGSWSTGVPSAHRAYFNADVAPMLRRGRPAQPILESSLRRGPPAPEAAALNKGKATLADDDPLDGSVEPLGGGTSHQSPGLDEDALQAWDAFLAEMPYGQQLAGKWADSFDGLRKDREVVSAARRARRERREAEATAALARETRVCVCVRTRVYVCVCVRGSK